MKIDIDSDTPEETLEETLLKMKLAELERLYRLETRSIVDRLVQIQALKLPRYRTPALWPENAESKD